jgi:tol-pal system protein YbgF
MRYGYKAFVLVCMLVFIGGCWGRNFFRAPQETLDTSSKVDSLLEENAILHRRVYQLEKTVEEQQEYNRRASARSAMDLEEIKDQLNTLLDIVAEGEGVPPPSSSVRHSILEQDTASAPDSLAGSVSAADSIGGVGDFPVPEEMYRQIYLDFSRMEYEIALEESEVFLSEYPKDRYAEDVRFIRGECYSELGKDFDAISEFSTILQEFPRGRKTPAVLLRMGIIYQNIGENDLAAGVVNRLIREYPSSEEAAVAKERFANMLDNR